MGCCGGGSSADSDEEPTGGGGRTQVRTFEAGSSILQKGRRKSDSELDLLKSTSAVTSTLRGLLKDSMGQVTDAAPNSRAVPPLPLTRAHPSQRYFLKFCHAEFSSENPEYWLAVQAGQHTQQQPPCSTWTEPWTEPWAEPCSPCRRRSLRKRRTPRTG